MAKLKIENKTGLVHDTTVWVDGVERTDVQAIRLGISADDVCMEAMLILTVDEVEVDLDNREMTQDILKFDKPAFGVTFCSECGKFDLVPVEDDNNSE